MFIIQFSIQVLPPIYFHESPRHKEGIYPKSFTSRYNITKLVYYESFYSIEEAIEREKQVKGYSRAKKIALIVKQNPEWKDLFDEIKNW